MPKFFYRAKKGPAEIIEGHIDAETEYTAISKLAQLGCYPIKIEKENSVLSEKGFYPSFFAGRVALRDMAIFTHQLSDLLGSGVTMLKALGVLSEQTENRYLKAVIENVMTEVKDGATLSSALSKHPKVFSRLFTSMVHAGEVGGMLEDVLKRLAGFYEKEEDVRGKIQTAMAYPILVSCIGVLTVFVLLSFVVPKLTTIFLEFGQALPLPTRILIQVSDFFAQFWWLILLFATLFIFLLTRINKTSEGKFRFDSLILSIPAVGEFLKKVEISRFTKSLATLLDNGVPILQALEVVSEALNNEVLKRELMRIRAEIGGGASFSGAISSSRNFPLFVKNMISIGEEGGTLEDALHKVSGSYERDSDRLVKIMTSLIEPLMILSMGVVVGFIVIAMLLPIFQINLMVR
ncbi:MAG: type II secretion system F family protein [Candidatus Omnitrophota bacterium]|nr:type II secretion system F family protein [Candidatus Omnitrophota bacterium]